MKDRLSEAKKSLDDAEMQLVDAYLGKVRESYTKLDENKRLALRGSLEKFVEELDEGKVPSVVKKRGVEYQFNGETAREP